MPYKCIYTYNLTYANHICGMYCLPIKDSDIFLSVTEVQRFSFHILPIASSAYSVLGKVHSQGCAGTGAQLVGVLCPLPYDWDRTMRVENISKSAERCSLLVQTWVGFLSNIHGLCDTRYATYFSQLNVSICKI